jgi:hypothetical protein
LKHFDEKITLVSDKGFGKLATFDLDLYADLVAPTLHSSLKVESWQNGGNKLNSDCKSNYTIMNINAIKFDNKTGKSVEFPSTKGFFSKVLPRIFCFSVYFLITLLLLKILPLGTYLLLSNFCLPTYCKCFT